MLNMLIFGRDFGNIFLYSSRYVCGLAIAAEGNANMAAGWHNFRERTLGALCCINKKYFKNVQLNVKKINLACLTWTCVLDTKS